MFFILQGSPFVDGNVDHLRKCHVWCFCNKGRYKMKKSKKKHFVVTQPSVVKPRNFPLFFSQKNHTFLLSLSFDEEKMDEDRKRVIFMSV